MSSGKSYSLVGVQDTDKAIWHARLSADERKRLSSLANWKPQGHSVLQVGTADFLFSSALFWLLLRITPSESLNICSLQRTSSICPEVRSQPAKRGNGSSPNVRIRFPNAPLLSPFAWCLIVPVAKVKRKLEWQSFKPQGVSGKSPHPQRGSISPKKLCESNSATFDRAAGTNKRR